MTTVLQRGESVSLSTGAITHPFPTLVAGRAYVAPRLRHLIGKIPFCRACAGPMTRTAAVTFCPACHGGTR